jgi:hypothetical protein
VHNPIPLDAPVITMTCSLSGLSLIDITCSWLNNSAHFHASFVPPPLSLAGAFAIRHRAFNIRLP